MEFVSKIFDLFTQTVKDRFSIILQFKGILCHNIRKTKIVKRGITEKNIQWTACICVFAISLVELHSHLIMSLQKLMSQDSQRQPYCSKSVKKKLSLSHFICLF